MARRTLPTACPAVRPAFGLSPKLFIFAHSIASATRPFVYASFLFYVTLSPFRFYLSSIATTPVFKPSVLGSSRALHDIESSRNHSARSPLVSPSLSVNIPEVRPKRGHSKDILTIFPLLSWLPSSFLTPLYSLTTLCPRILTHALSSTFTACDTQLVLKEHLEVLHRRRGWGCGVGSHVVWAECALRCMKRWGMSSQRGRNGWSCAHSVWHQFHS